MLFSIHPTTAPNKFNFIGDKVSHCFFFCLDVRKPYQLVIASTEKTNSQKCYEMTFVSFALVKYRTVGSIFRSSSPQCYFITSIYSI